MGKFSNGEIDEEHQVESKEFRNKSCQKSMKRFGKHALGVELPRQAVKKWFRYGGAF
jgi:hypothetical protein